MNTPQPNSRAAQAKLEIEEIGDRLMREQGGTLSVAAIFLPTGESVHVNPDAVLPTASVIKIAIVSELCAQAAAGKLAMDQTVTVSTGDYVAGSGVIATLTPGLTLPLADLALLTISISDNTASNLCLRAVGGPAVVNARMRAWGMEHTTIHRPIKFDLGPDDPPCTATGSARDMLRLLILLYDGQMHDRAASDVVLDLMGKLHDDDRLSRYLEVNPYAKELKARPPFVVRHKTGGVTGVRNDAALISSGEATLAVCAYSAGVRDARWTSANAGSEALADVGRVLCSHFFP